MNAEQIRSMSGADLLRRYRVSEMSDTVSGRALAGRRGNYEAEILRRLDGFGPLAEALAYCADHAHPSVVQDVAREGLEKAKVKP